MESGPSSAMAFPMVEQPYSFVGSLSSMTGLEPNNLMEVLSRMIYGSNMISMAGGSLPTTYRTCYAVFEGVQIPEEITENDFEYNEISDHMEFRKMAVSHESILRCYREIVQHAKAARYLITKIVLERQAFDEATFQEANRLLTYNIDLSPQMPWTDSGGHYRPWNGPRDMRFLDPTDIPSAMLRMTNDLSVEMSTRDMHQLRQEDVYERISYACQYCQRFILIHPFADGNGRMYRLFLTTLLLRAGICPAVYGLYEFDRSRHWQAESSCYMQGNQDILREAELGTIGTSHQLVKFVVEHTYGQWRSPDHHMRTFLQVTGQGTGLGGQENPKP
ncbi:hypothetical protein FMUND_4195 [Fusarium mundagurra]|uniref:Fido domain-containing protein n=1 Tax=Fusarium mundagurra TaxID=1567541 RepID=A0A8H6DJW2_9HYPO|nr:hypothetical protein FMUND_4195 [Fusarium mundagurra]